MILMLHSTERIVSMVTRTGREIILCLQSSVITMICLLHVAHSSKVTQLMYYFGYLAKCTASKIRYL